MSKIDMFLAISGSRQGAIRGESLIAGHTQEIEISGWTWGMAHEVNATAHGASKASAHALTVIKPLDNATTAIMSAMKTAELLGSVVLTCRDSGGERPIDYLRIKLGNARIATYDVGTKIAGATEIVETITFRFKDIEVNYSPKANPNSKQGVCTFIDSYE